MGIQDEDIARVRAASDFVAVAGEHIQLTRAGRNYKGLCPFHAEKSPSFTINADKGLYYCFGCQAKGDIIRFVMELDHLDFAAAVEKLAVKSGITLRYDNEAIGRDRKRRERLRETMTRTVDFYHQQLLTAPGAGRARAYLKSRGYDGEAVRAFRLGWAPEGWDTLMRALSMPADIAKDTGLGYVNRVGRLNDFFQARILFPIFDVSGEPIAFGGRKLPDADGPKYKNSSETLLYSKSRTLYGLNWAKQGIVDAGEVIVCEGYTDVIGFHRVGLNRAVATCGTALADEHFKMLKNFARRIVLAYDADAAGQNAAEKFYEWEKRYEIDLRVVALPAGADPGDLARTDPERLRVAVAEARPFLAFRLDRELAKADLRAPEGRGRAFELAADLIREHPSPFVREQYLREVGDRCQISEDMMARVARTLDQRGRTPPGHASGTASGRPTGQSSQSGQAPRRVANADPGSYDDDRGRSGRPPVAPRLVGRVSSPLTQATAASGQVQRAERQLLTLVVHEPQSVLAWVDSSLFALDLHARSFQVLVGTRDVHEALHQAELDDELGPDVADLLQRLAVEEPTADALDVVALVVSLATTRAVGALTRTPDDPRASHVGAVRLWQMQLTEPETRLAALNQLVPWLSAWAKPSTEIPLRG